MIVKPFLRLANNSEIRALEKIATSLANIPQIEKIIAFGSRVRGDFKGSSDLDILLILSDIRIKNQAIGILHDIELEYDVPISAVIFTEKEYAINAKMKNNFIANVEKEGIILYDASRQRKN